MNSFNKKFLNCFLSLSIVTYPVNPAIAEDPVATAAKVIEQTRLSAQADAQAYVNQDFQAIMNKVTNELAKLSRSDALLEEYNQLILTVAAELQELSDIDIEGLRIKGATTEDLESFIKKYESTVRDLFMSQWAQDLSEQDFLIAQDYITLLTEDFSRSCQMGHSNPEKSYVAKGIPQPQYISYFEGEINLGKGNNDLGLKLNYGIETAGSEEAAKDRRLALDIAMGAAEITGSAFLAQSAGSVTGTAAFSAGSSGAMLAAAAPYMIAVVVVVMIVTTLSARAEAYKIAKKVNKANELLASETPDHNDITKYYQEACTQYSGLFNKVAAVFGQLPKNGSESNKELKAAEALKPAIDVWGEDSTIFEENTCKINLDLLYREYGCFEANMNSTDEENYESLKILVSEKNSKAACKVDRMQGLIHSNITGKSCELPLEDFQRKAVIEKALNYNDAYNKKYSMEKVTELLAAQTMLMFRNQYEIQQHLKNKSLAEFDELQSKTLEKMMSFISLVQELRPLTEGEKTLEREFEAQMTFFDFRDRLLEIGVVSIRTIFTGNGKPALLESYAQFEKDYSPFYFRHLHIKEVKSLMTSFQRSYSKVQEL